MSRRTILYIGTGAETGLEHRLEGGLAQSILQVEPAAPIVAVRIAGDQPHAAGIERGDPIVELAQQLADVQSRCEGSAPLGHVLGRYGAHPDAGRQRGLL